MGRRVVPVLVGAALLALTACGGTPATDLGASTTTPSPPATPSASPSATPSATAGSSASPTVTASARKAVDPSRKYAIVTLGKFAKDPAAQSFAKYAAVRTQAFRSYNPKLPGFSALTTAKWRQRQGSSINKMKRNGWTIPAPARWSVVGLSRTGSSATLRTCVWGPSTVFLDAKTRKPVEKYEKRWYAGTADMVKVDGVWKVGSGVDAKFSCRSAS